MSARNHNNSRMPDAYYASVLRILIDANADALTYPAMAQALNAQNITTPTGLQWSGEIVKQLMKKLRNYKLYPSFIHAHLMTLIFEEKLTLKETLPLFKSRRHGTQ
jgi:hypothetical protein